MVSGKVPSVYSVYAGMSCVYMTEDGQRHSCVIGHRSLTRDLEAQVAVITTNQKLREALQEVHVYSHPLAKFIAFFKVHIHLHFSLSSFIHPSLLLSSSSHSFPSSRPLSFPQEQERMFAYGHPLSLADIERAPDRKLKLWQWIVTTLLKRHV